MHKFIIIFLIFFFTFDCESLNILVLEEVASPSHHLWIRHVTTLLAKKGYNVTSLSADIDEKPIKNLHYLHLDKVYENLYNNQKLSFDYFEIGMMNSWSQLQPFYDFSWGSCEGAVKSTGWKQLEAYPNDFKFDIVIHDYPAGFCHLAFLEKFNNPPLLALSAASEYTMPTAITNSLFTPSVSQHYTFKELRSTLLARIENYLMHFYDYYMRQLYLYPKMDEILKNYTNLKTPPIEELRTRAEIVLFNYNPIVDLPEQLAPNVIGVGGLQIAAVKPLPEDFQIILDNASNGVVLFSLGTNVPLSSMGDERLTHILEAFRVNSQYTIICKSDLEKYPMKVPDNVHMKKWLPQSDILAHQNTKLFITHSGLLSTQEAIWHGVPILGMPVFSDQFLNVDRAVRKGLGEKLYWSDLSSKILAEKIRQIIETSSYDQNMKKASKLFRDQPETPLERAIWWIEWLIRHPNNKSLRGIKTELNVLQRQSIDVIFVLYIFVLVIVLIIATILLKVFNMAKSALDDPPTTASQVKKISSEKRKKL